MPTVFDYPFQLDGYLDVGSLIGLKAELAQLDPQVAGPTLEVVPTTVQDRFRTIVYEVWDQLSKACEVALATGLL